MFISFFFGRRNMRGPIFRIMLQRKKEGVKPKFLRFARGFPLGNATISHPSGRAKSMNERVVSLLGDLSWLDRPERFSFFRVRPIRSKRSSCSAFWSVQNERLNESTNEFVLELQRSVPCSVRSEGLQRDALGGFGGHRSPIGRAESTPND